MADIRLDDVSKVYTDSVRAVDDVTLVVEDGEFLVLVGPSGCGKSTLLRMIAGLEDVDGGHVRIGGRDVTHVAPRLRDVAMVFQNYALYPHMTVRENLGYGLRVSRVPKAEAARRIERVASLLGLEDLLDRKPGALSGGQRQRTAMGRALRTAELGVAHETDDEDQLLHESRTQFNARINAHMQVRPGERLELTVDPLRFHFFDAETGVALQP